MNNKIYIEIVGWYGMFALIVAYGLVSFQFIGASDFLFQILNLTGALGIVVHSVNKKAYPSAILNIFWSVIAVVAILNIIL